jgi:hypothetical protein
MAFTYGGSLVARTSSASNPITFTLTTAAKDTVVVLLLKGVGATSRAGGAPTWRGSTFTQANSTQKAAVSPEASAELWYLVNPGIGTGTLTLPNTGPITVFYEAVSGTASGGGGAAAFGVANGANATGSNPSPGSVTTVADGSILFAVAAGGWQTWSPSAQGGTVITNSDDGADGYGSQYFLQSALGAKTMDWTFGTSDDWGAVVASFREIPPVVLNNYMSVKAGDGYVVGERIR